MLDRHKSFYHFTKVALVCHVWHLYSSHLHCKVCDMFVYWRWKLEWLLASDLKKEMLAGWSSVDFFSFFICWLFFFFFFINTFLMISCQADEETWTSLVLMLRIIDSEVINTFSISERNEKKKNIEICVIVLATSISIFYSKTWWQPCMFDLHWESSQ